MSERMWGFVLVREVLASLLPDLPNILEEGILWKAVPEVPWDRATGLGGVPEIHRGIVMEVLCAEAESNGVSGVCVLCCDGRNAGEGRGEGDWREISWSQALQEGNYSPFRRKKRLLGT